MGNLDNRIKDKTMNKDLRFQQMEELFKGLQSRFSGYELITDDYGVSLVKNLAERSNMSYIAWEDNVRGPEFSCKKPGSISEVLFWDITSAIAYFIS